MGQLFFGNPTQINSPRNLFPPGTPSDWVGGNGLVSLCTKPKNKNAHAMSGSFRHIFKPGRFRFVGHPVIHFFGDATLYIEMRSVLPESLEAALLAIKRAVSR